MPGPVLLIEDDADTRHAMTKLLAAAGFRVFSSDEGRKALELAGVMRPALVVVDLVTQGMSGWEFLEQRRHVPALSQVPVVVVTGDPGAPPPEVAAVFRKPVDPAALVRTVRRLVGAPARA
jgi:DNA-binding response OmpR family regulator